MAAEKLVKTNIEGLDAMLHGGIPDKSQVLIAGTPGTGKTLLGFELLYRAAKNGIQSTYIVLDETPQNALRNIKLTFSGINDIDRLLDRHTLAIDGDTLSLKIATTIDPDAYSFGSMISDFENIIKEYDAKFVVLDSMSFIKLMLGKTLSYRRSLISMFNNFKRLGVTVFYTMDLGSNDRANMKFKREFFLFDGLITLYQTIEDNERARALEIIKMRGCNHSKALVPYDITNEGLKFTNV